MMPDLLTLPTTFYDVSVLCNIFSKAEMRQFGPSGNQRKHMRLSETDRLTCEANFGKTIIKPKNTKEILIFIYQKSVEDSIFK